MFVKDDEGFCKSVQDHEAYWMEIHSNLLKEDLKAVKSYDSFLNGFEKLPDECRKLLIQLRPMLYKYYREEPRVGKKRLLEHMIGAMRLLRKEYCRRKSGQYVLRGDLPDISKFFGRVIGNHEVVDFRITYEAKQAAAEKKAQQQ